MDGRIEGDVVDVTGDWERSDPNPGGLPPRKYVNEHGEPVNEKGEELVGSRIYDSDEYGEFREGMHENSGRFGSKAEEVAYADELEAMIPRMPDGGEREDAQWRLADLRNDIANWREFSPEYTKALAMLEGAIEAGGTPQERIARIDETRDRLHEMADSLPRNEARDIRARFAMMDRVREAIEMQADS